MSAGEQARAAELRAAFVRGCEYTSAAHEVESMRAWRESRARELYPDLATPRVVTDAYGAEWRFLTDDNGGDGHLQRRWIGDGHRWAASNEVDVTPSRVRLWADLMALPFIRDGVPCATVAGPEAGR